MPSSQGWLAEPRPGSLGQKELGHGCGSLPIPSILGQWDHGHWKVHPKGRGERVAEELRLIVARGESLAILVPESSNVLMAILPRDAFEFVPHVMFSGVLTKVMPKLGLGAFDFLSEKTSGSKICVVVLRMVGPSPSVVC